MSAKKAPMTGVKKQVPIQVDTLFAASTLLSWSSPVRKVTRFFATPKKTKHSTNSVPSTCSNLSMVISVMQLEELIC